ncbi:hypothetical protein KIL84_002267 [Mauremys mutica]|uniref:Uncharacterized protein n=1 Tax=Mauremys mutica TaxID=74926 RepID=A0A9D3X761_9SAUR|nr:hypothetical protein KIL84_002267 [Mauremys mutica]
MSGSWAGRALDLAATTYLVTEEPAASGGVFLLPLQNVFEDVRLCQVHTGGALPSSQGLGERESSGHSGVWMALHAVGVTRRQCTENTPPRQPPALQGHSVGCSVKNFGSARLTQPSFFRLVRATWLLNEAGVRWETRVWT